MKNRFTANYAKIAVIAVSLAIAVSCTVAGTLAAFSATYTWSGSATAGDINFSDTSFTLDIFGDGYIFPGESGSAELGGVDFGENPVEWSFSSSNASVIPVVFYTLSESGTPEADSFYSEYDFSALSAYFAECPDGSAVAMSAVSDDVTALASHLEIGGTLCWAWFFDFFTDETLDTPASGAETDDYREYCLSLCHTAYAFPDELAVSAGERLVYAFVTGEEDGVLVLRTFSLVDSYLDVRDGLIGVCGVTATVETAGAFATPGSSDALTADSAVWVLVPTGESAPSSFEEILDAANVRYSAEGAYSTSQSDDGTGTATPDEENGTRILYKIYPSAVGEKASISVTVTATVVF